MRIAQPFDERRRALHFGALLDPSLPNRQLGYHDTIVLLRAIESAASASQALCAGESSATERAELLGLVARGVRAKRTLVESNLRSVWWCARSYARHTRAVEVEDLVQEGVIGFLRAVDDYGSRSGHLFEARAHLMMQESIRDAVARHAQRRRASASETN